MNDNVVEIVEIEKDRKYELYFAGSLYCTYNGKEKYVKDEGTKRQKAYGLIPAGCRIIPANKVSEFDGKLIGGIMADSIIRVYGIGQRGIRGYYCSIYFIPSEEHLKSIVHKDDDTLKIKG